MICLSQASYLLNSPSDSAEEVGPQSAFGKHANNYVYLAIEKMGTTIFFYTPTYKIQVNLGKSRKRNIPYLKESCHLCA